MPSKGNGLILSIRREHAARIFEGSKQFELRKSLPTSDVRRVYLYESGGVGIIGCFDPARIIRDDKDALWKSVNYKATTQYRFNRYFENWLTGCAIEVANPIRFDPPIGPETLRDVSRSFRAPMSAIVLELDSPLGLFLERKRTLFRRRLGPEVELIPISENDRSIYQKLVLHHVGERYEGIDGTFAVRNLDIHDLGHDPAGFFTERKQVLSIMRKGTRIGFTTITWKSNGCAKTGPTIIERKHRRKGLGRAARRALELRIRAAGYRKIYCTSADDAHEVIGYLLDSGMKIEAHLDRQYSAEHGELVFGKFLVADEYVAKKVPKRASLRGNLLDIKSIPKERLRDAIVKLFSRDWLPIDAAFADRILKSALAKGKPDAREKAKRIVCAGTNGEITSMIIMLPKRGGAVKALLCSATDEKKTLLKLVEEVVHVSCGWGSRKVYFLHPLLDSPVVTALKEAQFQMEGFLKAPYIPARTWASFRGSAKSSPLGMACGSAAFIKGRECRVPHPTVYNRQLFSKAEKPRVCC